MAASGNLVEPRQFKLVDDFARHGSNPAEPIIGQNLSRAGVHNRALMLHHIRSKGPISRQDLAELIGLTLPAVANIARDLVLENWVMQTIVRDGSRGPPASLLSINPDAAFSIGLNVDRDHITYVVLDFGGRVREVVRRDIQYPTPNDVKQAFAKCLTATLPRHLSAREELVGIGVSIPDDFAKSASPWLQAQWRDVSLDTLFADITPLPIVRENDAAAAAIGEMIFGGGLEVHSFFYLYLSVGLGGGLVINRHYVRGSHGRGGELGCLPQVNPFRSSRSALGKSLEQFVSVQGFLETLGAAGYSAALIDLVDMDNAIVQSVIHDWVRDAADLLYLPLLSTMCVNDPDAIFIGGEMPASIIERLALEINKRLSMNVGSNWPDKLVRPATVNSNAAAVGAGVIAFRDLWDRDLRE